MSVKQSKQKNATKNNIFFSNKNITLPFEKRNEELKNINFTTKYLFLIGKNNILNKVPNDYLANIPNNEYHISDKTYTLVENRRKQLLHVVPSVKGNFKLQKNSVNNRI